MANEQRKPFWRFDRDQTNHVSTERIGRGQPRADSDSPVAEGHNDIAGHGHDRATATSGPTADQLRHAIDTGRGRDKIAFPDPAAAPLGTDDEAAGTTPGPQRVATAMGNERRTARPAVAEKPDPDRGRYLGMTLMLAALAALALVVFSMLR